MSGHLDSSTVSFREGSDRLDSPPANPSFATSRAWLLVFAAIAKPA